MIPDKGQAHNHALCFMIDSDTFFVDYFLLESFLQAFRRFPSRLSANRTIAAPVVVEVSDGLDIPLIDQALELGKGHLILEATDTRLVTLSVVETG